LKLPGPLVGAKLIRRYKRFLADVELETGEVVVAHVANTGAMTGLDGPGLPVWLSKSANPKRKLAWSLELVELPTGLVGINTGYPNKLVAEAIAGGHIPSLAGYETVRPEVRYGKASRVDFLLSDPARPDCYLEVKNVHLSRLAGVAQFPDAATARGARHLGELANMAAAGHRAILLYLVQRTDCTRFELAADVDATYAEAAGRAKDSGVEFFCYDCDISVTSITLRHPLPIIGPPR